MKPIRIAALAALATLASAIPGAAQAPADSASYESVLARFQAGDTTVATALRMSYTRSDRYEPYGGTELNDALRAMFTAVNGSDWPDALEAAHKALELRYHSPDAHMGAALAYDATGDSAKAAFHDAAMRALIRSIGEGGGRTPESPMRVIDISEEYAFLRALGLRMQSRGMDPCGNALCDVMHVVDPQTGDKLTLYFDVSIPRNAFANLLQSAQDGTGGKKPDPGKP